MRGAGEEDLGILVLGEGTHELGRTCGLLRPTDDLPALPRLLHRLLDEPQNATFVCRPFRQAGKARASSLEGAWSVRLPPEQRAFARKAMQAIAQARLEGFHSVVILIDRDGRAHAGRSRGLREGRDLVAQHGGPPCAVGAAVEAFDAWMIADGGAIAAAGGDASRGHPNPETLDGRQGSGRHPKDRAADAFGGKGRLGEKYAVVATQADIAFLERMCPEGFRPFAQEVRERIRPIARA
jgi:hypothetical protein